ncbi:rCG59948 [Rattus norvegicus]|uniref:RCG59948 n=1 Tax=Rattus norvegicus TaxID=10116 RepID=A6HSN1_RAT|nr:rCG59948 [Rattus norvegicus]
MQTPSFLEISTSVYQASSQAWPPRRSPIVNRSQRNWHLLLCLPQPLPQLPPQLLPQLQPP